MKKGLLIFSIVAFCLTFLSSSPVSARKIHLRFSDQNSKIGWGPVHALQPWIEMVEEAVRKNTKHELTVNVYPNQTLSKGKDNWNSIKSGIADMGWCFHGYWPGMTPLADVISLPALPFKTGEKGSEVLWKLYERFPEIKKQFDDNHILLLYTTEPYLLITTKKQVRTLDDLKGMKVRMTGGPPTDQMKALGGIPMSIPMPDVYLALKQGVIDGMGTPWEAIHTYRFYEVADYYTQTPFPAVYFSIAVNKKKWNALPDDVKNAISSVSGLEGSKFWGRNFDKAREGVFELAKEICKDINLYTLPEEETERWLEIGGKPIWNDWVIKMEKDGYVNAGEILDTTLKLLKE
ncbi:MAG: TRAP transporter substrate-binding protein [Deltaproteobacteria bacterium]|nr:TRAP transporter substrate-binding protein [Deltaproteobacteria bacterium]